MKTSRRKFLGATALAAAGFSCADLAHCFAADVHSADASAAHQIIPIDHARLIDVPGLPTRLLHTRADTDKHFAIVEHTLGAGVLGAPPHRHRHEDEFSFVLEGELTVQLGEEVFTAAPRTFILKPRRQIHTFWNQGSQPVKFLEIISPAGFEKFFEEWTTPAAAQAAASDVAMEKFLQKLGRKYALDFYPDRVPALLEKYKLKL
jgi:mannose-6-phosphate isomerase-like protein (cupin superfamily)